MILPTMTSLRDVSFWSSYTCIFYSSDFSHKIKLNLFQYNHYFQSNQCQQYSILYIHGQEHLVLTIIYRLILFLG
jgi:hypothetical protein